MFNLLIVDDEPLITDSLFDLFAGTAEPELNALRAYSGGEALALARDSRIDILLTDISMPDLDGMEVHRRVKALWPDCAAIFLTSLDEFACVQQAMRGGGEDYILKTEGDEPVVRAVARAAARLDGLRRDRILLEKARNDLSMALPLLQAEFVLNLAESAGPPQDVGDMLRELQMPLDGPAVCMVAGRVDRWPENAAQTERLRLQYRIKGFMESYFSPFAASVCAIGEGNLFIELLQAARDAGPDAAESLPLRVAGSLDSLQAVCRETYGLTMSFAANRRPVEWADVGAAFLALRGRLRLGAGPSGGMLLLSDMAGERGDASAPMAMGRLGELGAMLEDGDREGFMKLFDELTGEAPPAARAEVYYRLAALFIAHMGGGHAAAEGRMPAGIAGPESHASWADAFSYCRSVADSIFEQRAQERRHNENRILAFIEDHARKHIGGDLSLTEFASLLNFHPFYLSRLFKQLAGQSLSDYIAALKMEKAREMLAESNAKIVDISTALGFKTPSYFTCFFRKYAGMSPVEYRNGGGVHP